MREILFKGKRLDNGEWVEGDLFHNDNTNYPMTLIGSLILSRNKYTDEIDIDGYGLIEVAPETVCQYTGLKDMNGKKIFEGDILFQKGFGHYYKEKKSKVALNHDWNCGCCNGVYGYFTEGDLDLADCSEAEVIGTIFDNPELLEVTE